MRVFDMIMLTGESWPRPAKNQTLSTATETYCQQAKRIGVTHVQVNFLVDPYHPILLEQPGNYYAWFGDYGAALDQFVSSSLNKGLYPEVYLAKNRKQLIQTAKIAIETGLEPVLMLCEPRFVPERFFQSHPHLRGPRVDNPACSTTPWYALCTDLPQVRIHYQQMLRKLMKYVPELAGVSIFTSDSGAGFCHSESLYCGPHGPNQCKGTNTGKRIAEFLGCLREAGAEINPGFFVSLATSITGQEWDDFVCAAPEGVTADIWASQSWHGGLEDQWAAHQYGSRIEQVGYEQARKERFEEYQKAIDIVKKADLRVIGLTGMPTDTYFSPIKYIPLPFQNIEILNQLKDMGVRELNCKGKLNVPPWVSYDVNMESFAAFQHAPEIKAGELIQQIATNWVGSEHAEGLIESWQVCDTAVRHRPMWDVFPGRRPERLPGPLVPDPDGIPMQEMAYCYRPEWADFESLGNRHRLDMLRIDEGERLWILKTYQNETLPMLQQAIQLLEREITECETESAKQCLVEQLEHIRHFYLWQRSSYNWCEAGCYLAPGERKPKPQRPLTDIIDDELTVTESMIELMKGRVDDFIDTSIEGSLHGQWPQFVEQLEDRIGVMKRHRDDSVVPISSSRKYRG